jgi:uncharacterized membrane protein
MVGSQERVVDEKIRVVTVAVAGVAASVCSAVVSPWQFAVLIGWDVAAAALVAWIWVTVWNLDADSVRAVATHEDDSRAAARAVVTSASVVSLAGVIVGLVKAEQVGGTWRVVLTVAAVATVTLSWLSVHTVFAMRYAHLYYADPVGGIDFSGGDEPDYHDFAYVAFTVGMTFQVSDTTVPSSLVRRTVLRQAMLSYLFGTVIVALLINVTAGLIR